MTQLWPEGVPIEVEAADGLPLAFRWQQRRHAVRTIVEQWVIRDEWWREELWRRYFQIETGDALLCVLYHDLPAGDWRLGWVDDETKSPAPPGRGRGEEQRWQRSPVTANQRSGHKLAGSLDAATSAIFDD